MTRTVTAAVALLYLAGTGHAADMCDKPASKLSANQYLDCAAQHDAAVKARQNAVQARQQAQQEVIKGEPLAETERKLRLRQPVPGEIPIIAPYREIPIR